MGGAMQERALQLRHVLNITGPRSAFRIVLTEQTASLLITSSIEETIRKAQAARAHHVPGIVGAHVQQSPARF